ncbi:MAG: DUF188 domain-containing protein [Treponema sp.]|nr:DUF188 domain-containing protein [Treponema sp.]
MTHIWIDADSCPSKIRNYVVNYSKQKNIEVIFVANKPFATVSNEFKMIVCDETKDSADNYIFENAGNKDLVITRDILFASRLVERRIKAINDRGTSFTIDNIKNRLEDREFDLQLAQLGFGGNKKTYGEKEFSKFKKCFEKEIEKLLADHF